MKNEIKTILQAIIDDEPIEYAMSTTVNNWSKSSLDNTLNVLSRWCFGITSVSLRIKPKTIQIGSSTIPEPLRVPPPMCSVYYYIDLVHGTTEAMRWGAGRDEIVWLSNGMLQATKEGAEQQLAAILSLTRNPE